MTRYTIGSLFPHITKFSCACVKLYISSRSAIESLLLEATFWYSSFRRNKLSNRFLLKLQSTICVLNYDPYVERNWKQAGLKTVPISFKINLKLNIVILKLTKWTKFEFKMSSINCSCFPKSRCKTFSMSWKWNQGQMRQFNLNKWLIRNLVIFLPWTFTFKDGGHSSSAFFPLVACILIETTCNVCKQNDQHHA